ncbi:serine hydrolase domain-containing protein [Intrasporangium flavum]|uniref:serine hydrolase domain-containing protein n=1 Tax=Intrasporangium flavum TaxID=1428657 RepID=UPI00096C771B|nr:serine hydrolase domain-containing protein [Intrasporangium flavum]
MTLPRSTPHAQDVDASGLLAFVDAVEAGHLGLHSLMVVRHGHVVAEGWWRPYSADRVHLAYSLSKTLTATAVGFLVQEGRLSLEDRVLDLFPEYDPATVPAGWHDVRVKHCLSMTVGHEEDAWAHVFDRMSGMAAAERDDWVPRVLATGPTRAPGTHFAYNQVATYLLSVIVGRLTGTGLAEALRPRLLTPLGLPDVPWHRDPLGRELGFTGAHLTTEGIASVAQLYLDRGRWQGHQLLPEAWVEEATRGFGPLAEDPATEPDWARGYGYSFWMQRVGFRGDGAFGQFLVVLPELDTVVAVTAEQARMQSTLDALWEHVVPAIGRPGSPAADSALADRLAGLEIPAMAGEALGPDYAEFLRSDVSDLAGDYTAVSVTRSEGGHTLGLLRRDHWLTVPVASGGWRESELVGGGATLPVVASGGWVDEDTFRAEVIAIETPHRFRVEARLRGGDADLTWRMVPLTGHDPLWLATRWA